MYIGWYSILIEDEFDMSMDELMKELGKKGIETRTFFIPMHEHPVFQKMELFQGERYPASEELSKKGVYLPSSSGLTEEENTFVAQLKTFMNQNYK